MKPSDVTRARVLVALVLAIAISTAAGVAPAAFFDDPTAFIVERSGQMRPVPHDESQLIAKLVTAKPDSSVDAHVDLKVMHRLVLDGTEYALQPDELVLMHKDWTKTWKSPGIRTRVLAAMSKAKSTWITTVPVYQQGQPIVIRMHYAGGDKGWDATLGYDEDHKMLWLTNNVMFRLTDAKGAEIKPRPDSTMRMAMNKRINRPFASTVDLNKLYPDLKEGTYALTWGSHGCAPSTIQFAIVAKAENE